MLFTCTRYPVRADDSSPYGWAQDDFSGRLVLNLCSSNSHFGRDLLPSALRADPIPELVVIFPARGRCLGFRGVPAIAVLRSLLHKLVWYPRTPSFSPIKTMFVNAESVHGMLLAKDFGGATSDTSPVTLREIVEVLLRCGAVECEHLSLEEYEARVG